MGDQEAMSFLEDADMQEVCHKLYRVCDQLEEVGAVEQSRAAHEFADTMTTVHTMYGLLKGAVTQATDDFVKVTPGMLKYPELNDRMKTGVEDANDARKLCEELEKIGAVNEARAARNFSNVLATAKTMCKVMQRAIREAADDFSRIEDESDEGQKRKVVDAFREQLEAIATQETRLSRDEPERQGRKRARH